MNQKTSYQDSNSWNFLLAMGFALNSQAQKLTESDYYFTADVTGASNKQLLIEESDVKERGIRNINGSQLNAGEHLALAGVSIRVAPTSSAASAGVASFSNGTSGVPAQLLNATLELRQNGKTIAEIPVSECLSEEKIRGIQKDIYYAFNTFKAISADETFEAEIVYPKGATVPTPGGGEKHFIRVGFHGSKVIKR